MNIQTEHLENHTARLTVEIGEDRLEKAKRAAAKKIAKQVNIPGFRKGKAPYNIILRNFGEATVINEAVEDLSQDVYREMMEQQAEAIQPYGPGAWEDFKLEPSPTFIYTVPLQPTVELGDYREVRLDYEEPEVDDETVDRAMERMREQEALVEESNQPIVSGNRVTLDIHSEFADESPEDAADEDEAEEAADAADEDAGDNGESEESGESEAETSTEDEKPVYEKGDQFIHEHDAVVTLNPDEEPVLPGFIAALEGAAIDEEREFELDVPADSEDYEDIAGRKIHFNVTVKKIEVVTLPELNDELAARITEEDDDGPLTLLELRVRMRNQLQEEMERRAKDEYAGKVLDEIVEGATVAYPDLMVEEQVESMLRDLDQRLRQQGMPLETYVQVTGQSMDDVKEQYRDPAINSLKRSLVMGELSRVEEITVKDAQIDVRIDEMLVQFGEQAEGLRSVFDTPQMRDNIANDLLTGNVLERLVLLGRGMEIPVEAEEEETAEDEPVVEDAEFTEVKAEAESTEEEAVADDNAEASDFEDAADEQPTEESPDEESVDSEDADEEKSKE